MRENRLAVNYSANHQKYMFWLMTLFNLDKRFCSQVFNGVSLVFIIYLSVPILTPDLSTDVDVGWCCDSRGRCWVGCDGPRRGALCVCVFVGDAEILSIQFINLHASTTTMTIIDLMELDVLQVADDCCGGNGTVSVLNDSLPDIFITIRTHFFPPTETQNIYAFTHPNS